MKKNKIALIVFLFSGFCVSAQNKLSLQQAIEMALQKNYSISIVREDANIAAVSNSYGYAGFLPSVTFLAATNQSNYNTKQEFNTGQSVNRKNALTKNVSAAVALNWTVFDGMKMFATKDKLEELEARGQVNLKIQIENTVSQIINVYFDAVRQQQLIKAANEALKIYEEREKIAQKKLDIGSGSNVDLMQAKLDKNAQKSALLKLNLALENAMVALNQLLSGNAADTYTVEDSISINTGLVFSGIKETAMKNNRLMQLAQYNYAIAGYEVKEARSTTLPQIGVNVTYNLTQTQNQVGLVLLNQNRGLNAGLTASLNLFNGFKSRTQIKIANYYVEQSKLELNQTTSYVDASLLNSWKSYQYSLIVLKLEEENIGIARENVTVALERFRVGSSNTIELMVAQRSFEEAISRLVAARYDAKVAETELLRLQGQLIK